MFTIISVSGYHLQHDLIPLIPLDVVNCMCCISVGAHFHLMSCDFTSLTKHGLLALYVSTLCQHSMSALYVSTLCQHSMSALSALYVQASSV